MMSCYCYILFNPVNNRTYVGYTVDPVRRLRQHNRELKGGARATAGLQQYNANWKFLCIIASQDPVFDKHKALSLEWHIKHSHRHSGQLGRIHMLKEALLHSKFKDLNFQMRIAESFYTAAEDILLAELGHRVTLEKIDIKSCHDMLSSDDASPPA